MKVIINGLDCEAYNTKIHCLSSTLRVQCKMLKKCFRLRVLALYSVIIVEINSTSIAKQHDVNDGDNRKALFNLIEDFLENMQLLRLRNLTIDRIRIRKESGIDFHNISTIRLSNKELEAEMRIRGWCKLDTELKIHIPLGYYEINGSIETTNNSKTYPFTISLRNIGIDIAVLSESNKIGENTEITTLDTAIKIHNNDSDTYINCQLSSILSSRMPVIKSQIWNRIFSQIKKSDLLSHFSTMKSYCFHSHSETQNPEQKYQIKQTHSITNGHENFTVNSIKIKNFYLNFTFAHDMSPQTINFVFDGKETDATLRGYHIGKMKNKKNPVQHKIKLIHPWVFVVGEWSLVSPTIAVLPSTEIKLFDNSYSISTRAWVSQYGQQLRKIIEDDLMSLVH